MSTGDRITEKEEERPLEGKNAETVALEEAKDRERPAFRVGAQTTFASFVYRNYRLWFGGQAASLVGTWMQSTAQGFFIYQLTNSPVYLGYVGFASGLPMWIFSWFGGVVSDRMSRRKLMLVTQTGMMLLAFILAGLTFTHAVQAWHIVILALLNGIANAFDAPARQSIVVELVDREDLSNAIALNATMFNLGTAVGPAVAGVAYALFGPAWCFTINGISFLAVIAALLMMDLEPQPVWSQASSPLRDLHEGLGYVASTPIVGMIILTIVFFAIFGASFATILPAWAVDMLHGDAATNGYLQSARGLGSLIGALAIASLGRTHIRGKILTLGSLGYPLLLLAWSFVRWLPLSLLMLVGVGIMQILTFNMANILVQSEVPDHLRGRVMSIYTLGFFGFMPLGAMLYGGMAEWWGEPITVGLCAGVLLAYSIFLYVRLPWLRKLI
ncbi:MAG TPA: MFS transporter [Anaerolineaceae bacterium]|nr:MFS transporter [Anaerolineaceae bacterium]